MCYYSKTLHPSRYRDAKAGEDLIVGSDEQGHHYAVGKSDGKIVCLLPGTEVHVARFEYNKAMLPSVGVEMRKILRNLQGKEVHARFVELNRGYSADGMMVDGARVHFIYMAVGTEFYIGAERVPMETRLGVDDPSIMLDHKEPSSIFDRVMAKVNGLCSITR